MLLKYPIFTLERERERSHHFHKVIDFVIIIKGLPDVHLASIPQVFIFTKHSLSLTKYLNYSLINYFQYCRKLSHFYNFNYSTQMLEQKEKEALAIIYYAQQPGKILSGLNVRRSFHWKVLSDFLSVIVTSHDSWSQHCVFENMQTL